MSPSRNLPLCLHCRSAIAGFLWRTASLLLQRRLRLAYRPETIDSGFASARRHRVSLATYSSIDSSFANARFHRSYIFRRRQHVAVPKPTALPSLPLGNRGVSLADCVSSAQASTSSRFRRRQHVAVPKPTALPSLPLGNRGVSLADCVSSAQASTSSRFRRRQHVSTCFVIGKLS